MSTAVDGTSRAKSAMSGVDFFDAHLFIDLVDARMPAKQFVAQKLVGRFA